MTGPDGSLKSLLEGVLWLGVLAGNASLLLIAAANVQALQVGLSWLALTLWFWLVVFYVTVLLVTVGILLMVSRFLKIDFLTLYPLIGLIFLLFVGLSNASLLGSLPLTAAPLPVTYWGIPWLVVLSAGMLLMVHWPEDRFHVRVCGLVSLAILLVVCLPYSGPNTSLTVEDKVPRRRPPVLLLGLDGADWDYLQPLIDAGDLPNLARLKEESAWGRMTTIQPTKSPAVWTSIATGEPPPEHGITQFVGNRLLGGSGTFSRIRSVGGIGLRPLLLRILRLGAPLHGGHRREASYWEITSAYDQPVVMVNWWMSWPATPIQGWMVTERVHARSFGSLRAPDRAARVTYPPSLRERVDRLRTSPDEVTYADARRFMDVSRSQFERMKNTSWRKHELRSEFKYMYSMFETNRRITSTLLEESRKTFERPVDLMVTFRILDVAGHTALRYSELIPSHPSVSRADERRYGRVVTQAYREVDRAVGEVLEKHGDGYVFVVSDHGFEYNPDAKDPTKLFDHDQAPDGIWMLSGPGVREGNRGPLSVYEVLPVMAYLKGFSLSLDWSAPLPEKLFTVSFLRENTPTTRPAYDPDYVRDPTVDRSGWNDRAFKQRLKALGYLK